MYDNEKYYNNDVEKEFQLNKEIQERKNRVDLDIEIGNKIIELLDLDNLDAVSKAIYKGNNMKFYMLLPRNIRENTDFVDRIFDLHVNDDKNVFFLMFCSDDIQNNIRYLEYLKRKCVEDEYFELLNSDAIKRWCNSKFKILEIMKQW